MDLNESKSSCDKIPKNTFEAINKTLTIGEFNDVKVNVEGELFSTNSFILKSSSAYFRENLKDITKEKDMILQIKAISAETFRIILNSLHEGLFCLNKNNALLIWSAVVKLDMPIFIDICENFVLSHLCFENLEIYKAQAVELHSGRVLEGIKRFFIENFAFLSEKKVFLETDIDDFMAIIERDDLIAESEDSVLKSIFCWVQYGQFMESKAVAMGNQDSPTDFSVITHSNRRKKYLEQLLLSSRYFLATETCLLQLNQHPLVVDNICIKNILFKASVLKLRNYLRGSLSCPSIYRTCWGYEHVFVLCNKDLGKLEYISIKTSKTLKTKDIPASGFLKLAVVNNILFCLGLKKGKIHVYQCHQNTWTTFNTLPLQQKDPPLFFIAHQDRLCLIGQSFIRHFSYFEANASFNKNVLAIGTPVYAMSIGNQILIFSLAANDRGMEETVVHGLNLRRDETKQIHTLGFGAKHMISFDIDEDAFILDSKGNLIKVIDSQPMIFKTIGKLWGVHLEIISAHIFRKTLHIYISSPANAENMAVKIPEAQDIFTDIKLVTTCKNPTNIVQMLLKSKKKLV